MKYKNLRFYCSSGPGLHPTGPPNKQNFGAPHLPLKLPYLSNTIVRARRARRFLFKNHKCAQSASVIYAFIRKKLILGRGPGALRPARAPSGPSGALFWPGPPDICQCSQVGDPALPPPYLPPPPSPTPRLSLHATVTTKV